VVGARNHLYFFLFCYLVTSAPLSSPGVSGQRCLERRRCNSPSTGRCCMGTWEVICYKSMTAVTAAAVQARCASAAAAAATPANRTASSPPAPPPPPDPVPPKAAEARGPAGQPAGEGSGARRYGQKAQGKVPAPLGGQVLLSEATVGGTAEGTLRKGGGGCWRSSRLRGNTTGV